MYWLINSLHKSECHSEPRAACHSEHREESCPARGKLREESVFDEGLKTKQIPRADRTLGPRNDSDTRIFYQRTSEPGHQVVPLKCRTVAPASCRPMPPRWRCYDVQALQVDAVHTCLRRQRSWKRSSAGTRQPQGKRSESNQAVQRGEERTALLRGVNHRPRERRRRRRF